jgi:D-glycero-alpha-D-manno-heptose-7-phosphate kinase
LKEGGAVLSTTIDKYCYIECRYLPPFFDIKHRIVWSHIETVSAISEILHPAVREGLRYMGFDDSVGLEIHHQGDLPARGGTGSSSSFSVGLLHALTALKGETIGRHELALKAIDLERNVMKEHVGDQDQVSASYGGLNLIRFGADGAIEVERQELPPDRVAELESRLMLFYVGASRMSTEMARQVIENIPRNEAHLRQMARMVDEAAAILAGSGGLGDFGELLHESWMHKRELSDTVSNETIDGVYETARRHGALGGKLMGAGGTGFMVFYVPEERRAAVKDALSNLLHVAFKLEREGSTLIYRSPDILGGTGS